MKNGESSKIFKVFYDGDVSIFLEKYSQVQYMFCGRFHSLILSMLFGHKIFPLSYSSKMNNTLDDLGYRGNIIDLEKDYFVEVENLENQFNMNVYNIDNEQQSAKDHFLILDHFLNS
ncbi:Polysaccharide pyruvyl transferase [compost metagenome]